MSSSSIFEQSWIFSTSPILASFARLSPLGLGLSWGFLTRAFGRQTISSSHTLPAACHTLKATKGFSKPTRSLCWTPHLRVKILIQLITKRNFCKPYTVSVHLDVWGWYSQCVAGWSNRGGVTEVGENGVMGSPWCREIDANTLHQTS